MKGRIIGLAGAAIWLVVITEVFVVFGLLSIGTASARWTLLFAATLSLLLIGEGIALIRMGLRLSSTRIPPPAEQRVMARRFIAVFAAEIAVCGLVNWICIATDHFDMIPAMSNLIVGLHFFPLAWIFRVPRYQLLGAIFCAVAVLTLGMPPGGMLSDVPLRYVLPSFGVAPGVWFVAWGNLREALRELRTVQFEMAA